MTTGASIHTRQAASAPAGGRAQSPRSRREWMDAVLVRAVDAGLAGAILLVPLLLGGRIALGQLVLVLLALGVALAWCLRQCVAGQTVWVRSSAETLLLATLALAALQLTPLPPAVLQTVSPQVYEALPLWAPGARPALGAWTTLSLSPVATRQAFVLLTAFALLFTTAAQRVGRVEDVERLLRWMAVGTVSMAAFALVQYLASNGRYFWFFQHPYSRTDEFITGSFTNRNHFAQYVALGTGPLVWWIVRAQGDRSSRQSAWAPRRSGLSRPGAQVGLLCVGLALSLFAGLMSLSRGGAAAIVAAVLVATAILYRGSLIGRRSLAALVGAVLFVGACLGVYGYSTLTERLDDFGSLENLDPAQGRRKLWQASLAALTDYPLAGAGLGSHRDVCPMYHDTQETFGALEYTHAENGYAQIGLEAGIPGLLLLAIAVGLCGYWCFSGLGGQASPRSVLCFAAIVPGLAASLLHSAADFVWYIPGCMVAVTLLAACALRLSQLAQSRRGRAPTCWRPPRVAWIAAACGLLALGYPMVRDTLAAVRAEPFWFRYLQLAKEVEQPGNADRGATLQSMAEALSAVLDHQPDHARAHARLAQVHLGLFACPEDPTVCPMDVRQVRDAVRVARFESAAAVQDWLCRAFGDRLERLDAALRHARRAVGLCPLLGEAYLDLAELSFREGENSPGAAAYLGQALRVRPFDGDVHFAAGQEAILSGDLDAALRHWRGSFHSSRAHQDRLVRLLAGRVPVAVMLDAFAPDHIALKQMASYYRQLNRPEELEIVLRRWAEASQQQASSAQGAAAGKHWGEAAAAYEKLNDLSQWRRCLDAAVACDPFQYPARRALATCLYKMNELEESERHLTWCLQRNPRDNGARGLLEAIQAARWRPARRPTPSGSMPGSGRSAARQSGAFVGLVLVERPNAVAPGVTLGQVPGMAIVRAKCAVPNPDELGQAVETMVL